MIVLGIDVGSTTGWAELSVRGGDPRVEAHGTRRTSTLDELASLLSLAFSWAGLVVIEAPQIIYGAKNTRPLMWASLVGGYAYAHATAHPDCRAVLCSAADVRKVLCGRPHADDASVKAHLARRGLLPGRSNDHERDAIAAAWVGWATLAKK